MEAVKQYLDRNQIGYRLHRHPAVYTCEQAEKYYGQIPGLHTKNLCLKPEKSERLFLVILPAEKRLDLKKFAETVGVKKVSFARPEILMEKLGLEPGAVSPFGLINDRSAEIELFLDKTVAAAEIVGFHPNENTATVEITQPEFQKFLNTLKNQKQIIEI